MCKLATLLLAVFALTSCRWLLFEELDTRAVPSCSRHYAVWTGKEMLVACHGTWLKYNPSTDTWTGIRSQTYRPPENASAVWTGTELIFWGGVVYDQGGNPSVNNEGYRYNPATGELRQISSVGAPSARQNHTAVWTGTEMVVWGGILTNQSPSSLGDGGRYDRATDSWRGVSATGAPAGRHNHAAAWTGTEMLIWGGSQTGEGGRYTPGTDTWAPMSSTGAPKPRDYPGTVWDGARLFVAGGVVQQSSAGVYAAAYEPATDTWKAHSDPPEPTFEENSNQEEWFPAVVWTGQQVIMWRSPGGVRYEPPSDFWDKLKPQGDHIVVPPSGFAGMSSVWTGSEVIIWGGRPKQSSSNNSDSRTGLRYNPVTEAWRATAVVMPDSDL
jgi:N-acetylneuraminic acid mutarotase